MLLVVLCVFAGGILSLVPFVLDQWVVTNVNRMRALQVGMNLRAALDRSEKVLEKLEEIQREDSPVRLVAERLPELVETKLLEAQEKADADANKHRETIRSQLEELANTASSLEPQRNLLESIAAHYATREYLETGISRIREDLHKLSVQVGEVQRIYTTVRSRPSVDENEPQKVEVSPPKAEPDGATQTGNRQTERPVSRLLDITDATPKPTPKPKESILTVSSFIGIQNKIYLRGNGAGLSMDKGLLLHVTGIGEWQWKGEFEEPIECEILLNDDKPAAEGKFTLQPGEKKTVQPTFS